MAFGAFNLPDELARGNTRENRDRLTRWVGCDAERLSDLMQLYLRGNWREAQLAAGVVTLVADEHPEMMAPWLAPMLKRMQESGIHNAVVRTGMHVLQGMDIPRRLAGRVAAMCFHALEDISQPIAVRVFAMTVLVNLCAGSRGDARTQTARAMNARDRRKHLKEPGLAREVELAIRTVLPYGTGAFASRARHELARLGRDVASNSSHPSDEPLETHTWQLPSRISSPPERSPRNSASRDLRSRK